MHLDSMSESELEVLLEELQASYREHQTQGLKLDLTRGKPSIAQLELSSELDGILDGDYRLADGTDARGYGGLTGIAEMRELAAEWLGAEADNVIVGNNSSLELMYLFLLSAHHFGLQGAPSAWCRDPQGARFLCPVPGYDRHFGICEELGIDMIAVPMTPAGPDMDQVEALVEADPGIKGMWCVPKHSNPSGETYSDDTVRRIAALGRKAGAGFRVMWDNAYAVHDLREPPAELLDIMPVCLELGTEDSVVLFGSSSKVTFAGGGVAFFAGSPANSAAFQRRLAVMTIGPDKVNQLRHVRLLENMDGVRAHMRKQAAVIGPKFDCVRERLQSGLAGRGMGEWTDPSGGYFVSFNARPGLAREIVSLAAQAGVSLTPAGAAFPYGLEEQDCNIRLAPSFPPLEEVDQAMQVFVTCVQLASVKQRLAPTASG
ncbi:MAG: aminotransferase class I/II-fold pyridoxal phosphate-dependent enzyme [Gammaproteobacteria bacterium]